MTTTQPLRTAVVVRESENRWLVKMQTIAMGVMPIGPRLSRGGGLPDIPREATSRMEAQALAERWQSWLDQLPVPRSSKRRKRRI